MNNGKIIKRKIISPIRQEKLEEGRIALDTIGQISPLERIFELFKNRNTIKSGFSIRELALLFFPKQSRLNPKTGTPSPTMKAIDQIYSLLNTYRKSIHNRSMILHTALNIVAIEGNKELSESILYRMKTYPEYENTRKKLNRIILGLQDSIENSLEILARSPEEIERRDAEFKKALEQIRHHKRKSSSDEDIYK